MSRELLHEAIEGKDEFSRMLAQARVRLGFLGFENLTNKELLALSHYTRSLLVNSALEDRVKEAVENCFFHITGYHTYELHRKGREGTEFSSEVKEFIKILRKKFNQNDDFME